MHAVDVDAMAFKGVTESVDTLYGPVSVVICGDRRCTPLLAIHDVGMDHKMCFRSFINVNKPSDLIRKNYCWYHLGVPGSQVEGSCLPASMLPLDTDKLVYLVHAILLHYKLKEVVGFGVGIGGYILSVYAAEHPKVIIGLILVSPACKPASWGEYIFGWLTYYQLTTLGWTQWAKGHLSRRLFAPMPPPSDFPIQIYRRQVCTLPASGVAQYLRAAITRKDAMRHVKKLKCRAMLVVGRQALYCSDSYRWNEVAERKASWIDVGGGGWALEEAPEGLVSPVHLFLLGLQQEGYGLPP